MKPCSKRADDAGRQKRDQQPDDEAPVVRVGEHAERNLPDAREVDRQEREDRAELDQHVEAVPEGLLLGLRPKK
jgi:hypothetical protein